jgi:hypothetical protein
LQVVESRVVVPVKYSQGVFSLARINKTIYTWTKVNR